MRPIELPPHPRILVIALRRIGDVLLTTPLVGSLRRAWPGATIDMLVFRETAGIVEGNPDLNRVIAMPTRPGTSDSLALLRQLWKRYDLAIATQSGDRPTFFAFAAGRKHVGLTVPAGPRIGNFLKGLALHRSVTVAANTHRVEQMLQIADALGVERVPELVCPAAPATRLPVASGENYAVIHAAPMFRYKEWTREGWRALALGLKQRGLTIVATSGPDAAERRSLDELWRDIAPVHCLPWPDVASLLTRARLYVGPDTSVSHLAAAAGCPTVVLFGPTDPRVWGPWPVGGLQEPWAPAGTIQRRGNVWLVQNPLPCLPCTFEGCERHIQSHSQCLDELEPRQVLAAADQALASRRT